MSRRCSLLFTHELASAGLSHRPVIALRVHFADAEVVLPMTTSSLSRPAQLSLDTVTEFMKARQTRDPEQWTLSMAEWLGIMDYCFDLPAYKSIERQKRFVSMYDMCDAFVVPWSKGTGCGLAVLTSKDRDLCPHDPSKVRERGR